MFYKGVENLFDEMFDGFDNDFFGRNDRRLIGPAGHPAHALMRTDVTESDNDYNLKIDLPGFEKDDIKVKLDDGMLTVSASKSNSDEKKDKKGHLIRSERYSGAMSRSWYVGDDVDPEKVSAKYEKGVLSLTVPKAEKKALPDDKKYIAIEG